MDRSDDHLNQGDFAMAKTKKADRHEPANMTATNPVSERALVARINSALWRSNARPCDAAAKAPKALIPLGPTTCSTLTGTMSSTRTSTSRPWVQAQRPRRRGDARREVVHLHRSGRRRQRDGRRRVTAAGTSPEPYLRPDAKFRTPSAGIGLLRVFCVRPVMVVSAIVAAKSLAAVGLEASLTDGAPVHIIPGFTRQSLSRRAP